MGKFEDFSTEITTACQNDPAAAFAPEKITGLRLMRRGDPAGFDLVMAKLKPAGVDVDRLEDEVDGAENPFRDLPQQVAQDPGAAFEPETVTGLAQLRTDSPASFERLRADLKKSGCRVSELDKLIDRRTEGAIGEDDGGEAVVEDLDPWPNPVDGATLADEISADIAAHVIFKTPEQADAVTLWTIGTYFMDSWSLWPKVYVHSPERRCGKTVLLEAIEAHVLRGFMVSNITAASLFRVIDQDRPTLLIDEADRFLRRNQEANGIINAGHRRRTARVVRTEERDGEWINRNFSVWAAQVIAGIGEQEDTLIDRSICVALRRRLPSEQVRKIHARYFERRRDVRRQLARWAADNRIRIEASQVEAPECGNDRATDNWTPLFQIAATLGGDWPSRCEVAMVAIESDVTDDDRETDAVRLMRDMARIIEHKAMRMNTTALCNDLALIEDAPWGEYPPTNRQISPHTIARLLKPYGVRPVRGNDGSHYKLGDLKAALERYTPPATPTGSAIKCQSATAT